MKLNELILVADAVERISKITETDDIPAIVDALVGLAWDEEDAGQIKAYHSEDPLDDWDVGADGMPVKKGDYITEEDGELFYLHKDGTKTRFV